MTAVASGAIGPQDARLDDLDRSRRRRLAIAWIGGLGAILLATMLAAVSLGPVPVALDVVWRVVGHHVLGEPSVATWTAAEDNIVWLVRVPRVLLGAVVGAALAVSGVAIQALVRNVLADPYLIGVTSGASTGAAAAILFGFGASLGASALSVSAFMGALGAAGIVFAVARLGGRVTSTRLVIAGVAVGYALAAATSFLIFASDSSEGVRAVLFWLLGSLSQSRWSSVLAPALAVAVTLVLLVLWGRRFDALAIGDDTALSLGVSPSRFRTQAFVVVSLAVGAAVAVSGAIGFVGLVAPHVVRRFVGGEHSRVLPVAALAGAIFLIWADVFARTAFQPREMPLGIVTAVVGTPFLLILVRRFHGASA